MSAKEIILEIFRDQEALHEVYLDLYDSECITIKQYNIVRDYYDKYHDIASFKSQIRDFWVETGCETARKVFADLEEVILMTAFQYKTSKERYDAIDITYMRNQCICEYYQSLTHNAKVFTENVDALLAMRYPEVVPKDFWWDNPIWEKLKNIKELISKSESSLDKAKNDLGDILAVVRDYENASSPFVRIHLVHTGMLQILRSYISPQSALCRTGMEDEYQTAPTVSSVSALSSALLKNLWHECDFLFYAATEQDFFNLMQHKRCGTISISPRQKTRAFYLIYKLSLCLKPSEREDWEHAVLDALGEPKHETYYKTRKKLAPDADGRQYDANNKEFVQRIDQITEAYIYK